MCEECRQTPCHPSCPNAPEAPVFDECDYCGGEIHYEDTYYEIEGKTICSSCVADCSHVAELEDEPDHDEEDRYE